jgi:hypothetical protein
MSKILHIHAEQVQSLDDIYTLVESYITDTTPLASRNLDALSDVLRELPLEKIVIHQKRHLKDILENAHDEDEEMTLYYRLLDVFIDLEGVDIELID